MQDTGVKKVLSDKTFEALDHFMTYVLVVLTNVAQHHLDLRRIYLTNLLGPKCIEIADAVNYPWKRPIA